MDIQLSLSNQQLETLRMVYAAGLEAMGEAATRLASVWMQGWDKPVRAESKPKPERKPRPAKVSKSKAGRKFKYATVSDHAVAIWESRAALHVTPREVSVTLTMIVRAISSREKRPSSAAEAREILTARGIVIPVEKRGRRPRVTAATKPVPTAEELGLLNSAGYFKAQVIRLTAEGKTADEIWLTMSEFIQSPSDIEKAVEKDAERIAMAKTLIGNELEAYLNGIAIAHNNHLIDRNLRLKVAA